MILPVPVPADAGEDALRFIDLSGWGLFFDALDRCWTRSEMLSLAPRSEPAPLPVVQVGSFEASYVPSIADFVRLDPRFRLTDEVWRALPIYKDWGFAVFRLRAGAQQVHPMGLEFPRRVSDAVYFPTVHVHDGRVHATANFAHTLYLQGLQRPRRLTDVLGFRQPKWRTPALEAPNLPRAVVGPRLAAILERIVDLDAPIFRVDVHGSQSNADVWLAEA